MYLKYQIFCTGHSPCFTKHLSPPSPKSEIKKHSIFMDSEISRCNKATNPSPRDFCKDHGGICLSTSVANVFAKETNKFCPTDRCSSISPFPRPWALSSMVLPAFLMESPKNLKELKFAVEILAPAAKWELLLSVFVVVKKIILGKVIKDGAPINQTRNVSPSVTLASNPTTDQMENVLQGQKHHFVSLCVRNANALFSSD